MKIYITVSGMTYRYGTNFIEESMVGRLKAGAGERAG